MYPFETVSLFGASAMVATVCGALSSAAAGAEPVRPDAVRPNIILIVADDLGVNDLSCYGRQDQSTPRLDRLASQGLRFTSAYAAQSVCSPTRAALMTGRAPARLHLTTFFPGRPDAPAQLLLQPEIQPQLPLAEITIAERLKAAGYQTGYFGKWHLGGQGFSPTEQGFDVYYPGQANTPPSAGEGIKGECDLTAHAEQFMQANRERPFFLYLAFNSPHIPLADRDERVENHAKAFNPVYAAMIESLDDCVGRLIDPLEKLGVNEPTIVVFTSDNGGLHVPEGPLTPSTHNTPFRAGKGFCYEGGLRIPLIVRWPGHVKAGAVVDTPIISTDWPPTLLHLAGTEFPSQTTAPADFDGQSLASLIIRGEALAPRALYWHLPHYTNQGGRPAGAIREADWKLVEHYEDGRLELFNLADDPSEATDVSAKDPGRVAELRGKLEAWRRLVGAETNTANPQFNAVPWRKLYRDVDVSQLAALDKAATMADKLAPWRKLFDEVLPGGPDPSVNSLPGAGAIILHARDAKVFGAQDQQPKLHYESEPHKDTLGFWVQMDDWAQWTFNAPGAGLFEVELLQGCGGGYGGSEVEISVGRQSLKMQVEETGHFQRFIPRMVGTVKLENAGIHTLSVRAKTKPGGAVMDLRRVTLRGAG